MLRWLERQEAAGVARDSGFSLEAARNERRQDAAFEPHRDFGRAARMNPGETLSSNGHA